MQKQENGEQTIDFNTVLEFRKQEAKRNGEVEEVIDEYSGEIGIFAGYKHDKKAYGGKLYLISARTKDGYVNYIYDEYGKSIAKQSVDEAGNPVLKEIFDNEGNSIGEDSLIIDSNVEINRGMLENQIRIGIEQIREKETRKSSSNASSQGGSGRDKTKEHIEEAKEGEEKEKSNKEEEIDELQENMLVNLKDYGISIEGKTNIKLDTVINGTYLWHILGIEEKLKGRLPKDVKENEFRTGFLTVIDSKDLEEIDGKQRNSKKTFAISTRDGNKIIELDENVIKSVPEKARVSQLGREQGTLNYRDGKEEQKPKGELDITEIARFEIPNANSRFSVSEKWYLSVDMNRDYKTNKQYPISGNIDEVSFVQQDIEQTQRDIELGKKELKTKLEAFNEPLPNREEEEMLKDLENRSTHEARDEIKEHINGLVEECKDENPGLTEYYNNSDIERMVKNLFEQGKDDNEIKAAMADKALYAEKYEHPLHKQ